MFRAGIAQLRESLAAEGRHLVILDHAHSQVCTLASADRPTPRQMIVRDLPVRSVRTLRHQPPADSARHRSGPPATQGTFRPAAAPVHQAVSCMQGGLYRAGRSCFAGRMSNPSDPTAANRIRPPSLAPPRYRMLRTQAALILREMGATYGRSPGGYVWALISPLGGIMILTLAFSLVARQPPLGTSFLLFYATGYLPFDLYRLLERKVATAMRYSRALLAYPGVTWLDAILARFLLTTLTSVAVFCIIITGVLIAVDTRSVIQYEPIIAGLVMAALLGLGVGMVNCLIAAYLPIWSTFWGIVTRPLFLASGIFFLYDDLPAKAQQLLWWNPLIHVTGLLRRGFYPTYQASYVSQSYGFALAMVLILIGLIFLRQGYLKVIQR